MTSSPIECSYSKVFQRIITGALLFYFATWVSASSLPVGYDKPASDEGGPSLSGGMHWIEKVFPRTIALAKRPSWRKPKVFFITNLGGVDTVAELNRRFPMDVTHYYGAKMEKEKFRKMLDEAGEIDCFVMSRFDTKSISADIQYEIFQRVAKGAGFVMIDDFDRSTTLNPKFLELKPKKRGKRVFTGIPYDGLRQWQATKQWVLPVMNHWNTPSLPLEPKALPYEFSCVEISPFGKGTVVWISTGTSSVRARRWGRTLLPHIDQRRDMWVETDYFYSHSAKAIKYACGIKTSVELSEIEIGPTTTVRYVCASPPFKGKILWQIRDTWGKVLQRGSEPVEALMKSGSWSLLGGTPKNAGRMFLDLWLENEKGETVDWGSAFKHVDRGVSPAEVSFKYPKGMPRGFDLEGEIKIPTENTVDSVRIALVDRHWRRVFEQNIDDPHETILYKIPTRGLDGQIWTLMVDLMDSKENILSRAFKTVTSPYPCEKRGGFIPIMNCSDGTCPEEAARVEFLRQLGFLVNRPYSGGNEIFAESMAWRDVMSFPFSFRITAESDDFNGEKINDWAAPELRRGLVDTHRKMTEIYQPFGLFGFNLGDDSHPRKDLPLGAYTTIAFHKWLNNKYGGLEETTRAWTLKATGFGKVHSWGRIHQKSVASWYEKGKVAPWIDAQLFMQNHWVDSFTLVKKAVNQLKPDARVGCDASLYGDAMSDMFGRLNYLAPYYKDYDVKVAVARGRSRRPGVYGATLGSYGDKPPRMTGRRGQIWDVLFAGGTGFYYWFFPLGLNEDLTLSGAHALYQCEVVEELMNGTAELFTGAQRVFDDLAILDSQTSGICDQLEVDKQPLDSKYNSIRSFQHAFEDLGFNPHIITDKEVSQGWLRQKRPSLLVLPYCNSLDNVQIEEIVKFVKSGGVVLADILPGNRDSNGIARKENPLALLFGVRVDNKIKSANSKGVLILEGEARHDFGMTACDPRVKPDQATSRACLEKTSDSGKNFISSKAFFEHAVEKGKAWLLNTAISPYDTYRLEAGNRWDVWYKLLKGITQSAKLSPEFVLTSEGRVTPGIEISPFHSGAGYLLGVEDLECPDFTGNKRPFEVVLPMELYIYEVRSGRYLGKKKILEDTVPRGGHRAYALLPYEIVSVDVIPDKTTLACGELLNIDIRLKNSPESIFENQVVRIEMIDPNGKLFFPMKRIVRLDEKGQGAVSFRFAFDDMPGVWTLNVTDVVSGKKISKPIMLNVATSASKTR